VDARRGLARRGGPGARPAQPLGDDVLVQPAQWVAEEPALGDALTADAVVVERLGDQRRDAQRVDHVRGQEGLHLARDLGEGGTRAGGLLAQRRGELGGDLRQRVAPQLEREDEVLLGLLHLVGHVELLGRLDLLLGVPAQRVDLHLEVLRVGPAPRQVPEELGADRVGLGDDLPRVRVVALERVLLLGGEAALDEDDEQDDHDQSDDARHDAANEDLLVLGRALAARPGTACACSGTATAFAARFVTLVEEGHEIAPDALTRRRSMATGSAVIRRKRQGAFMCRGILTGWIRPRSSPQSPSRRPPRCSRRPSSWAATGSSSAWAQAGSAWSGAGATSGSSGRSRSRSCPTARVWASGPSARRWQRRG
jgi:hypothetical protein